MNAPEHARLASEQQALLEALFARPGSGACGAAETALDAAMEVRSAPAGRGLAAYRANGHAMAECALRAAYPVMEALLGSDSFAQLARAHWHQCPPQLGDLAQWGASLPAFVQDDGQLAGFPYLADVARVEWAFHQADSARDQAADIASYSRLGNEEHTGLALTLAAGTALVQSRWPVASLVIAHRGGPVSLTEAAVRLKDGLGENTLVWRAGFRPRLAAMAPPGAALVQLLLAGADLPQALDGAFAVADESPEPFDFSTWLQTAVADGLVVGAHRLDERP